jgi:hypothetical protein
MSEFNAECICGGSITQPKDDCERCRMHAALLRSRQAICEFRKAAQLDFVESEKQKMLLAKTNLELQQFKDAHNRRLEFARAHLQDSAKKVKEAYDADE